MKSTGILLAAALAFLPLAPAAGWEYAYGPDFTSEQAYRRVAPVDCPPYGPGYISVGTISQDGFDPNVYVVYADLTGARFWERSYDVQDLGLADEGVAIAELPEGGGFVFLSNSLNGVWSPALTQIACDGRLTWSRLYPDRNGHNLRGRDLIRTANGQLAVAGVGAMGLGEDAFLMRTNPAGVPVWHWYYDAGGEEGFNALTEAAPAAGQAVGDLVAVGRHYDFSLGDSQGLAARVNGATGAIGGFPQCWAAHGWPQDQEVYNSVTPIADPLFAGQFALVGTAIGALTMEDVWLTRGNPCAPALHSRIGDRYGVATAEEGHDIREAAPPVVAPAGGLLAIAGGHGNGFGAPYDASFLQVATATLLPFGGGGRLFGDHGFRHEVFYSLEANPLTFPQGYILAGYTEMDWAFAGDPRDLYLVQYSPLEPAACEQTWKPDGFNYQQEELELLLLQGLAVDDYSVPAPATKPDTDFQICP